MTPIREKTVGNIAGIVMKREMYEGLTQGTGSVSVDGSERSMRTWGSGKSMSTLPVSCISVGPLARWRPRWSRISWRSTYCVSGRIPAT